jgi:hypothetical protein
VDSLDTDTSPGSRPKADEGVTALHAAHAAGLIRLGFVTGTTLATIAPPAGLTF